MANAARTHFECRHAARDQLDLVTIHVEYIARTIIALYVGHLQPCANHSIGGS